MSKYYDKYGEFVCPKCGASLGYDEFSSSDWDGDDYIRQSKCYCKNCQTNFIFSEKYEFNPDKTTCVEVDC